VTGLQTIATSIAALNATGGGAAAHLAHQVTVTGALKVTFSNGADQMLPILAQIISPYIELDEKVIDFGSAHLSCTQVRLVEFHNPTEAEVVWSIKHLPAAKAVAIASRGGLSRPRQKAEVANDGIEDVPEVFSFSSTSGVLLPRRGLTPAAAQITLRFAPHAPGRYKSTFVFKVKMGAAALLEVSAVATLCEEDFNVTVTEKHLSLMR
jgi:hypothetical protein